MIYKTLKKVSDVCQLFIPGNTHTVAGVTITNNGDRSLTIDGTGTGSGSYTNFTTLGKNNMPYKIGDKLFVSAYVISGTCSFLYGGFSQSGNPTITITNASEGTYYSGNISEKDRYESGDALGFFVGNNTFNNFRVKFNIINLTEMYGAGNEPTTVEQFRQDFPDELYDYKPYCFVKSYKTLLKATDDKMITSYKKSLACKTKNLFDKIGAALIRTDGSAASVNLYSWKGSKIYINYGLYAGGLYFQPITLSAGTYTLSAMASMNNINGSDRYVSIGYKDNSNNLHSQYVNISSDNQKISYTFTLTEETIICINLQGIGNSSNSSNLDTSFWDIQLELGDTATDYVPYGYL